MAEGWALVAGLAALLLVGCGPSTLISTPEPSARETLATPVPSVAPSAAWTPCPFCHPPPPTAAPTEALDGS